jgi:hypothetical protein
VCSVCVISVSTVSSETASRPNKRLVRTYHWISLFNVIYKVSKLAYRIWVILIAKKKSRIIKRCLGLNQTRMRWFYLKKTQSILVVFIIIYSLDERLQPLTWPHDVLGGEGRSVHTPILFVISINYFGNEVDSLLYLKTIKENLHRAAT